jgi:hypothetical protein
MKVGRFKKVAVWQIVCEIGDPLDGPVTLYFDDEIPDVIVGFLSM